MTKAFSYFYARLADSDKTSPRAADVFSNRKGRNTLSLQGWACTEG
ncbi:hypothetical protein [Varibaculum cambriense]|nr:hypothetical protein [Varibaculum cambriense]